MEIKIIMATENTIKFDDNMSVVDNADKFLRSIRSVYEETDYSISECQGENKFYRAIITYPGNNDVEIIFHSAEELVDRFFKAFPSAYEDLLKFSCVDTKIKAFSIASSDVLE